MASSSSSSSALPCSWKELFEAPAVSPPLSLLTLNGSSPSFDMLDALSWPSYGPVAWTRKDLPGGASSSSASSASSNGVGSSSEEILGHVSSKGHPWVPARDLPSVLLRSAKRLWEALEDHKKSGKFQVVRENENGLDYRELLYFEKGVLTVCIAFGHDVLTTEAEYARAARQLRWMVRWMTHAKEKHEVEMDFTNPWDRTHFVWEGRLRTGRKVKMMAVPMRMSTERETSGSEGEGPISLPDMWTGVDRVVQKMHHEGKSGAKQNDPKARWHDKYRDFKRSGTDQQREGDNAHFVNEHIDASEEFALGSSPCILAVRQGYSLCRFESDEEGDQWDELFSRLDHALVQWRERGRGKGKKKTREGGAGAGAAAAAAVGGDSAGVSSVSDSKKRKADGGSGPVGLGPPFVTHPPHNLGPVLLPGFPPGSTVFSQSSLSGDGEGGEGGEDGRPPKRHKGSEEDEEN
uniref:Uncharacterized protein n=1 Tax=Chromera velia CCMP2878 TaxID=1169474 RepID=A0A0G4GID5_9ALVE|eukprot:Cvel_22044.t1-p1 / transcript=Cvel_22044.t1 / gene=Cvel_22044 / organism=Chromera_velia_CCMP2878 / gene_product=hypothetical protein / transcript_product=hypothetical protein / location=Cvel_scaffold2128:24237-27665(+) / protein_length=462 / sequence_SO=supercontig / SO=protein_coding / is_pseudo=false